MPTWEELKSQFEQEYQAALSKSDIVTFAQSAGRLQGIIMILKQLNQPPVAQTTAMLDECEGKVNQLLTNLPPPILDNYNLLNQLMTDYTAAKSQPAATSPQTTQVTKKTVFREEFVTCGNRGCVCKSGKLEDRHGPYLYEIYYDGHGKRRRRSHGKMTLAEF